MRRIIISESEKNRIRNLHNINESLPELKSFPIKGGQYNIGWDKEWDDFSNPKGTANTDFSRSATHAGAGGHPHGHIGIDIFGPKGTPILSPVDGKVKYAGNGLTVIIEDPETGYSHWLGHLDTRTAKEGDFVFAGQQVGTLGDSGNAKGTAPHLHYNIFKTSGGFYSGEDPIDVLKGAIDAKPKTIDDTGYDDLGSEIKNAFKKMIGMETDEDNKSPEVEAKDEHEVWNIMKKAGSSFIDKLKNFFS